MFRPKGARHRSRSGTFLVQWVTRCGIPWSEYEKTSQVERDADLALTGKEETPLRLPGNENAIIDPEKLYGYLLSPSHPVGRFKAAFFATLGYTQENWPQFEADLRQQHLTKDAMPRQRTLHGRKYEIRGIIKGPGGQTGAVVSIWILLANEKVPRFVTAYPGESR